MQQDELMAYHRLRAEMLAVVLQDEPELSRVRDTEWAAKTAQLAISADAVEAHTIDCPLFDIETGECIQTLATVILNGSESTVIQPQQSDHWHVPNTEKEFNRSPHRAQWQTKKELKMDKYRNSYSFVEIRKCDIPKGTRIYRMTWAYRLKPKPAEKDKLNPSQTRADQELAPRLCLIGTGMDPEVYKTFADVSRDQTVAILAAIYATYMEKLDHWQADDSDAFQNTVTDGSDGDKPGEPIFSYPAPGFEKYDKDGQLLCYEHRTAFQGRRDSPHLYGAKVRPIIRKAGWTPLLYDQEAYQYLAGPSAGTADSLSEIIAKCEQAEQPPPGHKPIGWAMMCRNVDDKIGVETKSSNSRIAQWLEDHIKVVFATGRTGWKRVLGWDVVIDPDERTVTFECLPVIARAK